MRASGGPPGVAGQYVGCWQCQPGTPHMLSLHVMLTHNVNNILPERQGNAVLTTAIDQVCCMIFDRSLISISVSFLAHTEVPTASSGRNVLNSAELRKQRGSVSLS